MFKMIISSVVNFLERKRAIQLEAFQNEVRNLIDTTLASMNSNYAQMFGFQSNRLNAQPKPWERQRPRLYVLTTLLAVEGELAEVLSNKAMFLVRRQAFTVYDNMDQLKNLLITIESALNKLDDSIFEIAKKYSEMTDEDVENIRLPVAMELNFLAKAQKGWPEVKTAFSTLDEMAVARLFSQ